MKFKLAKIAKNVACCKSGWLNSPPSESIIAVTKQAQYYLTRIMQHVQSDKGIIQT